VQEEEKLKGTGKPSKRVSANAPFNSARLVGIVDWLFASDSENEKLQQVTRTHSYDSQTICGST